MEQIYWDGWIKSLKKTGLTGLTLTLLEGLAPMRYFLAQCLLAVSPFLTQEGRSSWNQFASMLEDPEESREFAGFLREKWT